MTLTSNTPQIIDLKTEILCTLGPSSMTEQIIRRLDNLGVSLFRINLSHTKAKNLAPIIDEIRSHTTESICQRFFPETPKSKTAEGRKVYFIRDI